MKGDFTRGFNPDTKRGQRYRRVLLQQGSALLDSDMTALSDALEGSLRANLRMTACHAGTSDLGLLVTPGQLLAQFDGTLGNAFRTAGGATAVRDYSRKYLDRLPGLRMGGPGGTVTIALAEPLGAPTTIRLWARADNGGANPQVNGTAINVPGGADYTAVDVTTSGTELVISVDPAARIWVAMIEARENAGTTPELHSAAGTYEVDGFVFTVSGGPWPQLDDPAGQAFRDQAVSPNNTRLVAYTEVWEHHITAIEDPGIRETALGGDIDTTTRTEVRNQVKLARVTGLALDEVADAFANTVLPSGTVTIGVANETLTADPCDLPVPGGYTGPENRLYRLEVHGTGGGATLFKWSRENGSELFAASYPDTLALPAPASSLVVQADAPLQDGDLVELLSDAIDMGDDAPATLDASGFSRPERAVGRLLRLSGGDEVTGSTRIFDLLDPLNETPVVDVDTARFGEAGLKLRRWSGLVLVMADDVYELEQGIEADIAGSFEPGDWWQYEARVGAANANGPAQPAPHGPERLFAPLAVLRQTPANQPMLLEAWLDSRFPRLCEIEADDVSYDGSRVGSDSDTVQEALDELFESSTGEGCGEIPVPEGADIRDIIDAIPNGGDAKICLGPFVRDVPSVVEVFNKGHITITGIGLGSLLNSSRRLFHFRNCAAVTLVDFAIQARGGFGHILHVENCRAVDISRLTIRSNSEAPHASAAMRFHALDDGLIRRAQVRDCRMVLGQNDTGILAVGVRDFTATDNDIEVRDARFDLRGRMSENSFASEAGRVFVSQLSFNVDTNIFVGGSNVQFPNVDAARHNVALAGWGQAPLRFSTHAAITANTWGRIAAANPPGNASGGPPSMRAHIRRVRRGVARFSIGLAPNIQIPATAQGILTLMGTSLAATARREYGHAGIIVSAPRGPTVNGAGDPSFLANQRGTQSVRVNGNRISGFHQGIRIGGDFAVNGLDTQRTVFRDVEVDGNRIDLLLPMYVRPRWGIMVGSAISVAVRNNRVINLYDGPTDDIPNPVAPTDGIRLWGVFGAFVQLERNACFGTSHGVRLRALNPLSDPSRTVWKVSDLVSNEPVPANALSGSPGSAEIVDIP